MVVMVVYRPQLHIKNTVGDLYDLLFLPENKAAGFQAEKTKVDLLLARQRGTGFVGEIPLIVDQHRHVSLGGNW